MPQLNPGKILRLGSSFFAAKTLLSAVELGVFTALAERPSDAGELARRLGVHQRAARDFFDALVALGMLDRRGCIYHNTPETAQFLDRRKPSYVGGLLEMYEARLYRFWGSLTAALRTGEPQNEMQHGEDLLQLHLHDREWFRRFAQAMTSGSLAAARAIAKKFSWQDYRTFTDVGTAQGGVPVQIALRHPHLHGTGFDLPSAEALFHDYVASFGLQDRLRFQAGNFFADPLPKADVMIAGHILHGLGLDEKRALMANVHRALEPGGVLLVFETIIDEERRENAAALLMSLNMLVETRAGFDFTGQQCRDWMRDAGFASSYVQHLTGPYSMIVGVR